MKSHPFLFLFGFAMGYLPVLFVLANIPSAVPVTQAEEQTPEPTIVVLETAQPSPPPQVEEKQVLAAVETPVPTETPTPAPTPTPDVWAPPEMEGWFASYAGQYGVDKNILERLANCESHFNVNSQNKDYLGMFQFSSSTWSNYRVQMGQDPNPALRTNAEESIKTAAYVIQQRGVAPWPSCLR